MTNDFPAPDPHAVRVNPHGVKTNRAIQASRLLVLDSYFFRFFRRFLRNPVSVGSLTAIITAMEFTNALLSVMDALYFSEETASNMAILNVDWKNAYGVVNRGGQVEGWLYKTLRHHRFGDKCLAMINVHKVACVGGTRKLMI